MRFQKSVLSQYLRTDCDLALYLTLFEPSKLKGEGLPTAIKARPSVESLKAAGIEQENAIYGLVDRALGPYCVGKRPGAGEESWGDTPLASALSAVPSGDAVLLQTNMALRDVSGFYSRLGAGDTLLPGRLALTAFVPDVVLVAASRVGFEVTAEAERLPVAAGDPRRRLTVVDVKHARDANPSYSAEVVLYALVLANWLRENGVADFYVDAETFLWTRSGHLRGALREATEGRADRATVLEAIRSELEPINSAIYLQAIRRFVAEKLPSVVAAGDADWKALEWGVGPRCGSCDFLAYGPHLGAKQREEAERSPGVHCFRRAREEDDLSRVPLLTKGAKRCLKLGGFGTASSLSAASGDEAPFDAHTKLLAERRSIPATARAIVGGATTLDVDRQDCLLARHADLNVYVTIGFDVGAGLLTGLSLLADFRQPVPFGQPRPTVPKYERSREFPVLAKSQAAEKSALMGFLQSLSEIFAHAHDTDPNKGGPHAGSTGTQIVFWSARQLEELCLALGRHLDTILYDRRQARAIRSLAWLFPPESLQETDDLSPSSPVLAFAQDTLKRLVHTPAEFATTLFGTTEHYRTDSPTYTWRRPDSYYAEAFSDAVPRERIYEIWALSASDTKHLFWGTAYKELAGLTADFNRALQRQSRELRSLCWRLRKDFGDRLRARSDTLDLRVPGWTTGVAHDSKLFIAWAAYEGAFGRSKQFMSFFRDPEEVEASHEGMRLVRRVSTLADGTFEYEVSERSLNSKLRVPSEYLCVSPAAVPGFAATRLGQALRSGLRESWHRNLPLSSVFGAKLLAFDRKARRATVAFEPYPVDAGPDYVRDVCARYGVDLDNDLILAERVSSKTSVERTTAILREIGDPAVATPAAATLPALGAAPARARRGKGVDTPVAQVLWNAGTLAARVLASDADAEAVVESANDSLTRAQRDAGVGLNESQRDAVRLAASRGLTVIWGPPGTGKTATCAVLVAGLLKRLGGRSPSFAVLLTGPNYKAVKELTHRVMRRLCIPGAPPASVFLVASASRAADLPPPETGAAHVSVTSVTPSATDPSFVAMRTALAGGGGLVVVATVTHLCGRIAEHVSQIDGVSSYLKPLFDMVLIDEASQVDMANAVAPLALMKPDARLVVAGDRLQMPPVFQVDPPTGAEHLVGSIQTYLVERFGIGTAPLLTNYRSHRDIVDYVKRLGYPPKMDAGNPDTRIRWLVPIADAVRSAESVVGFPSDAWIDLLAADRCVTALTYVDGMAGHANALEAKCVAVLARALFEGTADVLDGRGAKETPSRWTAEGFWTKGIGVVTPHRAQRSEVIAALTEAFPDVDGALVDAAVDTVERFQGGERHVIVVSFGVGDPDVIAGEERFLLQLERTNVAITRAMAKCIVLMSEEMAAYVPVDKKAAEGAHALKGIVDEWCDVRRRTTVPDVHGTARPAYARWRRARA